MAVKAIGTSFFTGSITAFSIHAVSAATAVLIAPATVTHVMTNAMSDSFVVSFMHSNVTGEAVHAFSFAPGLKLSITSIFRETWLTFLAVSLVAGIVADLSSEMFDNLFFSDTVAFEAVSTSFSAFMPLGFVTASWVV